MIGYLNGTLRHKQPPFLVLDVGGVGYELEAPMGTFYDLPASGSVGLFVHLVQRADALLLYGFASHAERELFRDLLRVGGVGPRVALAILSTLSARQLVDCIAREDAAALARVPGIGKKTAQRIILDLRDKLDTLATPDDATEASGASSEQDAVGALLALGYKAADANRAVRAVITDDNDDDTEATREQIIRKALQFLSK